MHSYSDYYFLQAQHMHKTIDVELYRFASRFNLRDFDLFNSMEVAS